MNDIADRPLDDILASIRKIVEEGQPLPDSAAAATPTPAAPPPAAAVAPPAPALPAATSLEAFIRAILEPQLKAWLAANLPELVERLTREEIERLTGH